MISEQRNVPVQMIRIGVHQWGWSKSGIWIYQSKSVLVLCKSDEQGLVLWKSDDRVWNLQIEWSDYSGDPDISGINPQTAGIDEKGEGNLADFPVYIIGRMDKRMTILADEGRTVDLLLFQVDSFAVQAYVSPARLPGMEIEDDGIFPVTDNPTFFTSSLLIRNDLKRFTSLLSLVSATLAFALISFEPYLFFHPVQTVVLPGGGGGVNAVHTYTWNLLPEK
jgi:hypothetical protein